MVCSLIFISGVSQAQYFMAVHKGSDINWQCTKCRHPSFHQFIGNVSDFAPSADSTHLSDLLTVLSPLSHSSENEMDTSDNITNITTGSDSSMLSFSTDVDIIEMTLASFNQPHFSPEESTYDSLPHCAIAADQPKVNYFVITASSNHVTSLLTWASPTPSRKSRAAQQPGHTPSIISRSHAEQLLTKWVTSS